MPDPDYDEEIGLPGTFEENLQTVLGVDADDLEDGTEEPEQDS
jgi:hypothetical protein